MMLFLPILLAAPCLLILTATLMVLRKMQMAAVLPSEVLQAFSAERYRPMSRLLDENDSDFILAGFQSRAWRRHFRAERRTLFRTYLYDLGADHARVVGAIRQVLVESQVDRPDLAKALYRCQFLF